MGPAHLSLPLTQQDIVELYHRYAALIRDERRHVFGPGCDRAPDADFPSNWRPIPFERFEARVLTLSEDPDRLSRLIHSLPPAAEDC